MKVIDIVARGSVAGRRDIIALLAVLLFSFSAASVAASAEDSEAGEFVRILGERAVDEFIAAVEVTDGSQSAAPLRAWAEAKRNEAAEVKAD